MNWPLRGANRTMPRLCRGSFNFLACPPSNFLILLDEFLTGEWGVSYIRCSSEKSATWIAWFLFGVTVGPCRLLFVVGLFQWDTPACGSIFFFSSVL